MKILILGNGGREHALCQYIKKSKKVDRIYCIPGNAGTKDLASNYSLNLDDFENIRKFIKKNKINIVIVGPEKPLVNGITDYLESFKIKVFGPNKIASKLEGSKIFTKNLCKKYKIPTANFKIFKKKEKAKKFLDQCNYPIVIKADGLAAGKGVYVCKNKKAATLAVKEIFQGKFGKTNKILFEEFLNGEEMSFFVISDGKTFKYFGTAQDHKRVGEGDTGPNTGGMGAYSPSKLENKTLNLKIENKIIKPTIKALANMGVNYKGFLYAGLMIHKNEPYLIEYNVRMGDPECQTILPRLKNDFFEVIESVVKGKLNKLNIIWENQKSLSIVICAKGYPKKFENNIKIEKLDKLKLKKNEFIFHAGTRIYNEKIFSSGGRILNIVAKSKEFKSSRQSVLNLIKKLNLKKTFYRNDIGYQVINK